MTPFLSEISISVHVRLILVDIITLAVGTPGLPEGAVIVKKYAMAIIKLPFSEYQFLHELTLAAILKYKVGIHNFCQLNKIITIIYSLVLTKLPEIVKAI